MEKNPPNPKCYLMYLVDIMTSLNRGVFLLFRSPHSASAVSVMMLLPTKHLLLDLLVILVMFWVLASSDATGHVTTGQGVVTPKESNQRGMSNTH